MKVDVPNIVAEDLIVLLCVGDWSHQSDVEAVQSDDADQAQHSDSIEELDPWIWTVGSVEQFDEAVDRSKRQGDSSNQALRRF